MENIHIEEVQPSRLFLKFNLYSFSQGSLKNLNSISVSPKCYKIKRLLLLGRKAKTNLDTILKSRDIALPTKVHLVKAMVFPVAMYGCERWTIKLRIEELMLLNCGAEEDS